MAAGDTTTRHERFAALGERVRQERPESWIPSAEDPLLVGEFVRLERGRTSYGESPIVVLRTEDGQERAVWLLHAVLRNELGRLRPRVGEAVAIHYLGRKTSGAGQTYEAYRVEVDRIEEAADWDAVAGDAGEEPPTSWSQAEEAELPTTDADDDIPF
jgi:hypothetical protein